MITCTACKKEVAEDAAKCPGCGHLLPAGQRNRQMMLGSGFIVFGMLSPELFPSHSFTSASTDNMTHLLIMCGLGIALILHAKFSNKFSSSNDNKG